MRLSIFCILCFFFLSASHASVIDAESLKTPILFNETHDVRYVVSETQLDRPPALNEFKPLDRFNVRCLDCVVWVKVDLEGAPDLPDPQELRVEISSLVMSAQVFRYGESAPLAVTGRQFAMSERSIAESTLLLPLSLRPNERASWVFRLSGRLPVSLQLRMYSAELWEEARLQRWFSLALYLGAVGTILLMNLFLFAMSDRRKERVYYILFQFGLHMVFVPNWMGHTILLWPDSVHWDLAVRYISILVGLFFLSLFSSSFLNLPEVSKRWNRWVMGLGFLIVLMAPMSYLIPFWDQTVGLFVMLTHLCVTFAAGLMVALRKHDVGKWFTAGVGFMMICAVIFAALNNGFIYLPVLSADPAILAQIGTFVESLVLALAISTKIFNERVQREKAESQHASFVSEARNAAEAASRAKSDFIRNMSHELRTPLNSLVGYSDFLLTSDCSESERREIVSTIKRQSEHLTQIVGDILDFANLEKGAFSISASPFNLGELLDEVRDFFLPVVQKKGVSIAIDMDPKAPPTFTGDRFRIRQILMNVIGNACKFSEHGKVQVRASIETGEPRPQLVVRVADEGPGILPEYQRLIFEPFYQVHSELSRKHGGMGLGLSYARDMARTLGGQLVLLRSQLGKGSEFEIRLPEAVAIYAPVGKSWKVPEASDVKAPTA